MRKLWRWTAAAVGLLSVTLYAEQAFAAQVEPTVARNVAMVHGAGPNSSSWAVAAPLQAANPLTPLDDDVAVTRPASSPGGRTDSSTRKWRDPRVSSGNDM